MLVRTKRRTEKWRQTENVTDETNGDRQRQRKTDRDKGRQTKTNGDRDRDK